MKPDYFKNSFTKLLRNSRSGFTLLELIIVIGIVAILGTVSVIVLNPAQMFKQTRDTNRITDMKNINQALAYYQAAGGTSFGSHNVIYVSLPSDQSDCSDLGLPTPPTGWSYACKPAASYRNTDGTGWIPADFTLTQGTAGNMFATLPIDPVNTVSGDSYYTYIYGTWTLSATLESTKYLAAKAASDGGVVSTRFEVGNDLTLNSSVACNPVTDSRDGKVYSTALIGTQCWMAKNFDYNNGCSAITWVNDTDVGWCGYYTGGPFTNEGLLYQWSAAMNGSTSSGAQGICPTGWHVPTDTEQYTLENYLTDAGQTCSATRSGTWDCSAAATKLEPGGTSGFNVLFSGYRSSSGGFGGRTTFGRIWSSNNSYMNAWLRYLLSSNVTVARYLLTKATAMSVRCVKN